MGGLCLWPIKFGRLQRGRRIGKNTYPKASQPYQVFFLTACNGHQVGLDLDGGIGRKSQLQPNSVWSWPFHMQRTNKLRIIFQRIWQCDAHGEVYQLYGALITLLLVEIIISRRMEELSSDDKSRASLKSHRNWKHHPFQEHIPFKNTSQSAVVPSHLQVCIVNPTSGDIDLTHGPWTNGLWPGTLSLLALHAEQLQWIHFQLDQYSILLWLESVDGCCWWQHVVGFVGSLYTQIFESWN